MASTAALPSPHFRVPAYRRRAQQQKQTESVTAHRARGASGPSFHSPTMSDRKNALDMLMNHAKSNGKRPIAFFACPLGCGAKVTEQDVNVHLDRCLGKSDGRKAAENDSEQPSPLYECKVTPTAPETNSDTKRRRTSSPSANVKPSNSHGKEQNAFSHMMKRSALLSKSKGAGEDVMRHRFHLHNAEGFYCTWAAEHDDDVGNRQNGGGDSSIDASAHDNREDSALADSSDQITWSAVTVLKKVHTVSTETGCQQALNASSSENKGRALELTISTSIAPFPSDQKQPRLVRRHSRLSVAQLKSCLQKSIRRRAPLPAVRVAMELADKSWGDLIRRLPIIVLEDSTLHPDFGLLVWLMVAESKGFFPPLPVLRRVMQIVFELASCSQQDSVDNQAVDETNDINQLSSFSLKTPAAELFPKPQASKHTSSNACEVLLRSMLLRAQYGGMKCDVEMLHSFATTWLRRFLSLSVPASVATLGSGSTSHPTSWLDVPRILHELSREKSDELVTESLVCSGGLLKLSSNDVCSAGIDFHCSSVVEHLLSQRELCSALSVRLAQREDDPDREQMARQLKGMIWSYSSGINHRRRLIEQAGAGEDKKDSNTKKIWEDTVKTPFDTYTKAFVKDRLA